jgi:chemotaxis response regulator CheB
MTQIYEDFLTEGLGLNPEVITLDQVQMSMNKESFTGNIMEGFNIFCLIN